MVSALLFKYSLINGGMKLSISEKVKMKRAINFRPRYIL